MVIRRFRFGWRITLFCVVFTCLFIALGFWQLSREVEKRELIQIRAERHQQPPVAAAKLRILADVDGLPVRLQGSYLNGPALLLDNRVLQGQVGYELLEVFVDDQNLAFLVNRGFLAMGRTRADLPSLPDVPKETKEAYGRVYQPSSAPYVLESVEGLSDDFPVVVQQVDVGLLAQVLGRDIYPFVIRLDENDTAALPRYWPNTIMQPEQHRGYAIQWFAMALALVIAWLVFSFRTQGASDQDPPTGNFPSR
jgi:surfeit locus 1 family protein